jgi:hypothetical protein
MNADPTMTEDPSDDPWKKHKINHLIYRNEAIIVYLDDVLDIEWATSKKFTGHKDEIKHNDIIDKAALLEATPHLWMEEPNRRQFRRLIGEGITRSLTGDYVNALDMLHAAKTFFLARSQETSRLWYLSASAFMASIIAIVGLITWYSRTWLQTSLGEEGVWLLIASAFGAIGALFSVITRAGSLKFDCSAGRTLHYLEGASRIWAGGLAGIIVFCAIQSDLIFSSLSRNGHPHLIMVLAAMAAGTSERLATSIISKLDAASTKETVESPQ